MAEAQWWYIHGFTDGVAFSFASFPWHDKWRVHVTVTDMATKERKVVTEDSENGLTSSLLNVWWVRTDSTDTHQLPRSHDRTYMVAPWATASVEFPGKERIELDVWYEYENGPINLSDGWRWLACRREKNAVLWYLVDGTTYHYRFERGKGLTVGSPDVVVPTPGEIGAETLIVADKEFGIEYIEAPIDCSLGKGFYECVQHGLLESIAQRVKPGKADLVRERLAMYALNDKAAAALLWSLYTASQLADDIADCDQPPHRITEVLRILGVDVPKNPFFRAHADVLVATLAQVIDAWEWSNEHEEDPDKNNRILAYGLKDAAIMYLRQVAFLVGGHEHARQVFYDAIRFFHGPGGVEPFEPR